MSGASSSNGPPRIVYEDVVARSIESPEPTEALCGSTFDSFVSSFEVVKPSRSSTGSSHSSITFVQPDPEAPEPKSESLPPPPPPIPVPTEEEEFLANTNGDTDEFGVRLCCLISGAVLWFT